MSSLDNDGIDRQTYEPPNCGSSRPHDQHFHSPIGGLALNCPGKARPQDPEKQMGYKDQPGANWTNVLAEMKSTYLDREFVVTGGEEYDPSFYIIGPTGSVRSTISLTRQDAAELGRALVREYGQEKNTWTVLGVWDNDEAVPIGALRGTHSVHGEMPGERFRDKLLSDPEFCGFDTSSFYEQGVWATTVEAPDGDTAQDLAASEMMHDEEEEDPS